MMKNTKADKDTGAQLTNCPNGEDKIKTEQPEKKEKVKHPRLKKAGKLFLLFLLIGGIYNAFFGIENNISYQQGYRLAAMVVDREEKNDDIYLEIYVGIYHSDHPFYTVRAGNEETERLRKNDSRIFRVSDDYSTVIIDDSIPLMRQLEDAPEIINGRKALG